MDHIELTASLEDYLETILELTRGRSVGSKELHELEKTVGASHAGLLSTAMGCGFGRFRGRPGGAFDIGRGGGRSGKPGSRVPPCGAIAIARRADRRLRRSRSGAP